MKHETMEKEKTMSSPYPGDRIEMPFMGSDVVIRVSGVPEEQPRSGEGVFTIVDQYDETHQVELDGETWITVAPSL